MKLEELCDFLDFTIPLSFQENYDNSGLQYGLPDMEINSALLTLDVTEEVINEATCTGCNIIISHHPVIFRHLKGISGRSSAEKIILKAIKQNIAVYSAHTNLDVIDNGVSRKMAEKIGLENVKVLTPLKNRLLKLVTFIPDDHLDRVRQAVFAAGAGVAGNYDSCGFSVSGTGSFRGNERSDPFVGERGKLHFENETRFETILFSHCRDKVIEALIEAHPYEEVAYDIYPLENQNISAGFGCTGCLNEPLDEKKFLHLASSAFNSGGLRHSGLAGRVISKVALCGGSGGSLINDAINSGADAFLTADIKYHTFLDYGNRMLIADIGHYESEKFSVEILYDLIIKKFPKFALRFSEINTNPINYL
ncbi:MAG TPA: Nif3-like dinuclear metal center hexameric protein [Bacteroidales bacterium]|nr:Nif3-like dinuclear metal center hexameric protein [Bacteroidales bacterium]